MDVDGTVSTEYHELVCRHRFTMLDITWTYLYALPVTTCLISHSFCGGIKMALCYTTLMTTVTSEVNGVGEID